MNHFVCSECCEPCQILHHVDVWKSQEIEVEEETGWGSNPHSLTKRTKTVNVRQRKSLCRACYDRACVPA